MASYKNRNFTIVFIGNFNPSILNHDFLVSNNILPKDIEPFSSLLKNKAGEQFAEFISTSVMAGIRYDKYSIVVEESRYQILDGTGSSPSNSNPILYITKSYFNVLQYTPLKLGGFNFVGTLSFENENDEKRFDSNLGIDVTKPIKLLATTTIRMGSIIRYPFKDGICMIQINKPKDKPNEADIRFNFEFKYTDINKFLEHLDLVEDAREHFLDPLRKIRVEVK